MAYIPTSTQKILQGVDEERWRQLYANREYLPQGSNEWIQLAVGARLYNPTAEGYRGKYDSLPQVTYNPFYKRPPPSPATFETSQQTQSNLPAQQTYQAPPPGITPATGPSKGGMGGQQMPQGLQQYLQNQQSQGKGGQMQTPSQGKGGQASTGTGKGGTTPAQPSAPAPAQPFQRGGYGSW